MVILSCSSVQYVLHLYMMFMSKMMFMSNTCPRIQHKSADVVCIITDQIHTFLPIFCKKKSAGVCTAQVPRFFGGRATNAHLGLKGVELEPTKKKRSSLNMHRGHCSFNLSRGPKPKGHTRIRVSATHVHRVSCVCTPEMPCEALALATSSAS